MKATPPIRIIIQLPLAYMACFRSCSTSMFLNPMTRPRNTCSIPIARHTRRSNCTSPNLWTGSGRPATTGPATPRRPASIVPFISTLNIGKPKNSPYMKPNIIDKIAEMNNISARALSPPVLNLFLITIAIAATIMPYPTSPSIIA
ncbi:Uncharacterised protein [uncultured archaeon]|nr:Uncharacterised protein [uncultured archaeon]